MKAILEFDLSDPDERYLYELAYQSQTLQMCLFDIIELFRQEFKYKEHPDQVVDFIDFIRDRLYQIIENRNLTDYIT